MFLLALMGHMSSPAYVIPDAWLRLRSLQHCILLNFTQVPAVYSQGWSAQKKWCCCWHCGPNCNILKAVVFNLSAPSVIITSDAFNKEKGAHQEINSSKLLDVSRKELRVNCLALRSFLSHIHNKVVQVLTDHSMVMYYVNKQAGSHSSSCKEAVQWWVSCIQHCLSCSSSLRQGVMLSQWRLNNQQDRWPRSSCLRHIKRVLPW